MTDQGEDWKAKYERSEASRHKLRDTLVLFRERTLNTEQLLKQHAEMKEKLTTEEKARKKAEKARNKAELLVDQQKKAAEETQTRLAAVEKTLAELHAQLAAQNEKMQLLESHLFGTAVVQGEGSGRVHGHNQHQPRQGSLLPISTTMMNKTMASTKGGAAAHMQGPHQDPVRARAVAALRTNMASKQQLSGTGPVSEGLKTNTGPAEKKKSGGISGTAKTRPVPVAVERVVNEGERMNKRARLTEHIEHAPTTMEIEIEPSTALMPPSLESADVLGAALRDVMGIHYDDAVDNSVDARGITPMNTSIKLKTALSPPRPLTAAIERVVQLLGPNNNQQQNYFRDPLHRRVVVSFFCAVLECSAAMPARRFLAAELSMAAWFLSSSFVAGGENTEERSEKSLLPSSFMSVWCRRDALEVFALPRLLHCAAELATAFTNDTSTTIATTTTTKDDDDEKAIKKTATAKKGQASKRELSSGTNEEISSSTSFTSLLARELAFAVVKDVTLRHRSQLSTTERCAAAAAASVLWRMSNDDLAFQSFLLDLLLSCSSTSVTTTATTTMTSAESNVLAEVAAAVDCWPEAVPRKGSVGNSIHSLLHHACDSIISTSASPSSHRRSYSLEARLAGKWLQEVGAAQWEWKSSSSGAGMAVMNANNNSKVDAARRQLNKMLPSPVDAAA